MCLNEYCHHYEYFKGHIELSLSADVLKFEIKTSEDIALRLRNASLQPFHHSYVCPVHAVQQSRLYIRLKEYTYNKKMHTGAGQ